MKQVDTKSVKLVCEKNGKEVAVIYQEADASWNDYFDLVDKARHQLKSLVWSKGQESVFGR